MTGSAPERRFQERRSDFDKHVDDCVTCQLKLRTGAGALCRVGYGLRDELAKATVAALPKQNAA